MLARGRELAFGYPRDPLINQSSNYYLLSPKIFPKLCGTVPSLLTLNPNPYEPRPKSRNVG